jgi:hypothetical protein
MESAHSNAESHLVLMHDMAHAMCDLYSPAGEKYILKK